MGKYKLFDFHTHVYPDAIAEKAVAALNRFYDFVCDRAGTYDDLERTSIEAGVSGFLMLGTATNAHQVVSVNDYVAKCVETGRSHGLDTYGFASMHQDFADFESELERIVKIGLVGVKLHPDIQRIDIDDEKLMPLYKACENMKLPVYLHVGDYREEYRYSEIRRLGKIFEAFPDLTIIAAHFGGWSTWELSDMFSGHKNLFYDTSSSLSYSSPKTFERLIEKLGEDNIMFGTDYPCTDAAHDLERFLKLDLSEDTRRKILYDNAASFLKKAEETQRTL